jgi:hypothetical protein
MRSHHLIGHSHNCTLPKSANLTMATWGPKHVVDNSLPSTLLNKYLVVFLTACTLILHYDILYCNGMLSGIRVQRLFKNLIMHAEFSSETLMIRGVTSISPYFSYYDRENFYSASKNVLSRFLGVSMKILHIAKLHILL